MPCSMLAEQHRKMAEPGSGKKQSEQDRVGIPSTYKIDALFMAAGDISYKLLWRGALGGLLGAPLYLIGVALNDKLRLGHVRYGGAAQIISLPPFMILGAAMGAITGGIIWLLVAKFRINLPMIIRGVVGICLALVLFGVMHSVRSEEYSGFKPPTTIETLINGLFFLLCFGALPGLMALTKSNEATGDNEEEGG
jgi:hypothetical protein